MTARLTAITLGFVVSSGAGCSKPFNESIDLTGMHGLPGLPALSEAGGTTELNGERSVTQGLDRQAWTAVAVGVPTNQVHHYPTYVTLFSFRKSKDPDKAEPPWDQAFPGVEAALVDETSGGEDAADAVVQPIWAAGLMVWAPFDMILGNWPWNRHSSPADDYARKPETTATGVGGWFDAPAKPIWRRPAPLPAAGE